MKIAIIIIVCLIVGLSSYFFFKEYFSSKDLSNDSSGKVSPPIREVILEISVRDGDVEGVKRQLEDGAIPTWWNWKSALGKNQGIPASQVKPEIAKLLVEAGADPSDFKDGWSYSKTTPQNRKRAIKMVLKGDKAEEHKDYETAKKMYLEALSLDPYLYFAKEGLKNIKNQ